MPPEQKIVAQRAIKLARRGLDNCIRSVTYREGLKYGMLRLFSHLRLSNEPSSCPLYSCKRHVCGVLFDSSRSFVVSLEQNFHGNRTDGGISPQECDPNAIMSTVEDLVHLLSNSKPSPRCDPHDKC